MMFTSISELDPGYNAGYDAGYDAALLVLSFPCAVFPFLFPLHVTIFHAPLSLETPTPKLYAIIHLQHLQCLPTQLRFSFLLECWFYFNHSISN